MVRTVHRFHLQGLKFLPPSITFVIMAITMVSLLSLVAFLCGSEKAKKLKPPRNEKTIRLGGKKTPVKRIKSSLSSKALLLSKMVSWRKVENHGEEEEENMYTNDDEEEAIWRKTIIKGEKCRPLDFSGKILYDSEGNLLPDSSHPPQSK